MAFRGVFGFGGFVFSGFRVVLCLGQRVEATNSVPFLKT